MARLCTTLYRERVASAQAARDLEGLAGALQRRLEVDGVMRVVATTLRHGDTFVSELAAACGSSASTPAGLAGAPELRGSVALIIATGSRENADAATFARFARRATDEQAPCLVWLAREAAARLPSCAAEPVRGVFDPLDGMAYVAALPRQAAPLESRLVASVAVETAAWAIELLDRLTALPIEQAVRPDLHVPAWDEGRSAPWKGIPAAWAEGSLDDWGGESAAHPAWLAANAPSLLAKRVWRGQVATLLPWIELHRLALVGRFRSRLRPDDARSGPEVELLDWGPLTFQVAAFEPRLAPGLQAFRTARNELAHGRPVTWAHVRVCLNHVERLAGT